MPLLPVPAAAAGLVVDLARIVGAQHVSNLDVDRLAYARDLWPRDLLRLRAGEVGCAPHCVVWPGSPDEVARVLDYARQHQIVVVPYGAGSGVVGGARPSQGGITLDLKRLRSIRRLDPENLRAEVEAGIIGERLERKLNAAGLTLGHFPSSIVCSTLGGWLAARSAGQMSTLYGKIEDMCFGLEVATPGRLRRSMGGPRPATPDFNALVIGSEGMFGAITAAELKLRPLPESRQFRGLMFPNVQAGIDAIRTMLRHGLLPSVVRLYDAVDTFLGRGHGDDDEEQGEVKSFEALQARLQTLVKGGEGKSGLRGRIKNALVRQTVRTVMGSPLTLNRALDLLPDDCLLVLGFEGHPGRVQAELTSALALARQFEGKDLGEGPGVHWFKNRYNVSYKQSKVYARGLFADTFEVTATWDRLLPVYKSVRAAVSRDAVVMAHFSHAYPTGCSIYFTFAGLNDDPDDAGPTLQRYDRIWKNALRAVHEAGGSISHHHGVGESKAQGMAKEHGAGGMRLLHELKLAFDPDQVLNPGKLGVTQGRRPPESNVSEECGLPDEVALVVGEGNVEKSAGRTWVRPPDTRALATVLRVASQRGLRTTSDQMDFKPAPNALVLDLSRLDGVPRISDLSQFAEAEAGIVVSQLEKLLQEHGLSLGPLHPRCSQRSVGAALARGLLLRRGPAFGDLGQVCFAVTGLLADGSPVDTRPVPRSATGPELDRAFIGAGGHLGLITKATLRVSPIPTHSTSFWLAHSDLADVLAAVHGLLHRGVRPAALRVCRDGEGWVASLDLVAWDESVARADEAIVKNLAGNTGCNLKPDGPAAIAGRFDAVVEGTVLWSQSLEQLTTLSALAEEVWLDFATCEGATVVARVSDGPSRRRVAEAMVEGGGRIVAGSRDADTSDLASFSLETGPWREVPHFQPEARQPHPYDDVLTACARRLDPRGVFRGRS